MNGRVASERTKSARGEALHAGFARLAALGYKLQKPENIGEKHIKALCESWYDAGYLPKTIQSNLSSFRIFCRWIGKGEMVKSASYYLPDADPARLKAQTVAKKSKSWAENGVDVVAKVQEADALDPRFGAMLRLSLAFGLRRHEVIECKPWQVDRGDKFAAKTTKGGRPRDIYIDTDQQRKVLDHIKSVVGKNERAGWVTRENGNEASVKFALDKWYRMLAKIGITKKEAGVSTHGLRAQYAENAALIEGIIPPTLGGSRGGKSKDDLKLKNSRISELLGHSRPSITGAYIGSYGRNEGIDDPAQIKKNIESAPIPKDNLKEIPPSRMNDCIQLTAEMMSCNALVDPRITHALWEYHSSLHGTDWLSLGAENISALESAALHFTRLDK